MYPLDPQYPSDRLAFMIQDADLKLVVTQDALAIASSEPVHFPETLTLVCLERDAHAIR